MLRSLHLALSVLVGACLGLTLLSASSMQAQGPPDTVWMRGSHFGSMGGIHFTPDGQFMVTTSQDIKVHHLPEGLMVRSFSAFSMSNTAGYFRGSALSPTLLPDGSSVLAALEQDADGSNHLRAWKIPDGTLMWDTPLAWIATQSAWDLGKTIAFTPDSTKIITWAGVSGTNSLNMFDAATGHFLASAEGSYTDQNGNLIHWGVYALFQVSKNQVAYESNSSYFGYNDLSFVTFSQDSSGNWSFSPGGELYGDGYTEPVPDGWAYSPQGDRIAAPGLYYNASLDGSKYGEQWMAIWPNANGSPLQLLDYLGNQSGAAGYALRWYNQIAWPVDGTFFAAGQNSLDQGNTYQSYVDRYDVSTGQVTNLWTQPLSLPPILGASHDGLLVGVAAQDMREVSLAHSVPLHVLDGATGAPLQYTDSQGTLRPAFDFHGNSVLSTAWSADGTRIATSSLDGIVKVWRALDGALLCSLIPSSEWAGPTRFLSFSPDGNYLVAIFQPHDNGSTAQNGPLQILDWDITNPDAPTLAWSVTNAVQPKYDSSLWPVAYSPDGKMVAAVEGYPSNNYVIRIRKSSDGSKLYESQPFSDDYGAVLAFSPDSKSLAIYVANYPASIKVYAISNLTDPNPPSTGQIANVSALCWSPDSKKLAYGVAAGDAYNSSGGFVLLDASSPAVTLNTLWSNLTSATCPLTGVDALAIDPCGQYLVTESAYASPDGPNSVFFYRMSDHKLMTRYDQEVGTGLGVYSTIDAVQSFSFSPDGQFYAYPRWDNGVVVARHPLWTPPAIKSLNFTASITGGHIENGSVTLGCPAPIGGVTISLSVQNPPDNSNLVSLDPGSVFIPTANTLSPSFQISAMPAAQEESAKIIATYTFIDSKGHKTTLTKNKTLTVKAPALSKLTLSSSKVKGGTSLTATITLTGPTAVDAPVSVTSSNPAATPVDSSGNPITSVIVPAGASKVSFTINTTSVSANTAGSITASLTANGVTVTKQVALTVTP